MPSQGGTVTVENTSRGWEVILRGAYHTVTRYLGTKADALEFAKEQQESQQAREKAQSGQESVYILIVEGDEVLTLEEETVTPDVSTSEGFEEAISTEMAKPVSEPEPEPEPEPSTPAPVETPVLLESSSFSEGKIHLNLVNLGGPTVLWRSIDGKTGTRKVPAGATTVSYKATEETDLEFKIGEGDNAEVIYSSR